MKTRFSKFLAAQLIVWNVGQGQWVTEVTSQYCLHYDLGGEVSAVKEAHRFCQNKMNYLFLSHWDWDHISFAAPFAAKVRLSCLLETPSGPTASWKRKYIDQIPLCKTNDKPQPIIYSPSPQKNLRPNDRSQIAFSKLFGVLLPGDSPGSQEKKWISSMPADSIVGLVLGHHGSRTSTSPALLASLPRLRWAVASSRFEKYGHPHAKVKSRLESLKIPLLRTEDWGHLHFLK